MTYKPRFSGTFLSACLEIAHQIHGPKGVWAYESFEFINHHFFADRLPVPFINWALTEHGGCLAWSNTACDKSRPPLITLHPSLLRGADKKNPWQIPQKWLGPSMAFDTLLHECMHVHIEYNLGGQDGRTSHDCKRWVRQVNRIAKVLGFLDVEAGRTKVMRVPDHSAPRTVRGKIATKVVRRTVGNIPFSAVAGFPQALRKCRGLADSYYGTQQLPPGAPRLLLARRGSTGTKPKSAPRYSE